MAIYNHFKFIYRVNILLICGMMVLSAQAVSGAGLDNYAKIKRSPEVERQVKYNRLPTHYNYYYNGRENLPWVVIGIDSKYKLVSKFWHEIKSHDQVINKIKHLMPVNRSLDVTYGKIVDAADNQIGVWFSEYRWGIVRFEGHNKISVFSPHRQSGNK